MMSSCPNNEGKEHDTANIGEEDGARLSSFVFQRSWAEGINGCSLRMKLRLVKSAVYCYIIYEGMNLTTEYL